MAFIALTIIGCTRYLNFGDFLTRAVFPICGGGNEKLSFCFLPNKPMMIAALGSLVVWGRGKHCDSFYQKGPSKLKY